MIKKTLVILLLICVLKTFSQTTKMFIHTNGKATIELKIANGKEALNANAENLVSLHFKNLDSSKIRCFGKGLSIIKGSTKDNPNSLWKIDLTDKEKNASYKFIFSYQKNNKSFQGEFEIPIQHISTD